MRLIAHDALTVARRVYGEIIRAAALSRGGNEPNVRAILAELDSIVSAELPVLNGVLAAQTQAAESLNLTQWTPQGPIPLRRKAAEQPDAANDHETRLPSEHA